jgi:hypothetical protein
MTFFREEDNESELDDFIAKDDEIEHQSESEEEEEIPAKKKLKTESHTALMFDHEKQKLAQDMENIQKMTQELSKHDIPEHEEYEQREEESSSDEGNNLRKTVFTYALDNFIVSDDTVEYETKKPKPRTFARLKKQSIDEQDDMGLESLLAERIPFIT